MKIIPKNFTALSNAVSPECPLVIFIRSGESTHNIHHCYKHCYHHMKGSLDQDCISDLNKQERLIFFDSELTEKGLQQAERLQSLLQSSGWSGLLESVGRVHYLCSPLSRSIQTALHAIPNVKFTVDDGVRERVTPLGPDLRRSFMSSLIIDGKPIASIQDKFIEQAGRLIWKWPSRTPTISTISSGSIAMTIRILSWVRWRPVMSSTCVSLNGWICYARNM